ncbi:MAG: hypothetical protein MUO24_02415 [Desulfobacterales bacterium]|nr:hypothetical protein [Desulfobacterales bacterium]
MMKRTFIILGVLALLTSTAWGAPFLVCDPYVVSEKVDQFSISIDGASAIILPAETLANGTTRIKYDLAPVVAGTHSVSIKAINIWGESAASPFSFTRSVPSKAPSGIGLAR